MAYVDELLALIGYEFEGEEDLRRFQNGMNKAEKRVKDFTRAASTMGKIAGAAFGALFGYQAQDILKTSGAFEKFEATLKTIEGSSEAAKRSMDWIADFSKTTPYQIAGVTDSFVKLKAYGIDPIANDTLRTLGDTASAMGKPLEQAVEALADAATGEFERLKEFGLRASQAGDEVTFSWSKNGEALTKTVGKNSDEIRKFILENFGSRFAGAMDEQSKTWFGMLSNFGDAWVDFQRRIGDAGYFDEAKDQLKGILDWLDRMDKNGSLDRWAQNISNVFTFVLGFFVGFVKRVSTHLAFLSDLYDRNAAAFERWGKVIGGVFAFMLARLFPVTTVLSFLALVIDDLLTYFERGDSLIGRFIDKLREIIPVSEGVAGAIVAMGGTIASALAMAFLFSPMKTTKAFSGLIFKGLVKFLPRRISVALRWAARSGLKGFARFFGRSIMMVIRPLGGFIARGLLLLAPFVAKGIAALFALLSNPIGWAVLAALAVGALVYFFWDELKAGWQKLGAWASSLFKRVTEWWSGVGGFFGIGSMLISTLWAGLKAMWSSVWAWGSGLMEKVKGWFNDIGGMRGIGEMLFNAYWEALKAVWSTIIGWAGGLLDGLIFFFTGRDTDFEAKGSQAINGFFDGLKNIWLNVMDWGAGLAGDLMSWWDGLDLFDAGVNVITSLWEGLKSIGNQITEWFMGLIPDWARDFVFGGAEVVGQGVQATGEALGRGAEVVSNAASGVAQSAQDGYQVAKETANQFMGWLSDQWSSIAPEISDKVVANLAGNIPAVQGQGAVQAVVEDSRQDNRDQSINPVYHTTINQTVRQAVDAPSELARTSAAAVNRPMPTRAVTGSGR